VLPLPAKRTGSAFIKLDDNANDLAIVNVAVRITVDGGTCADARVIVGGGCGNTPIRAASAEKVLVGADLGDDLMYDAGQAVAADIDPISDHRASAKYRRATAKVLVQRALDRAMSRVG
jgi:carbon-monoxide dehydrogenase medium subunit